MRKPSVHLYPACRPGPACLSEAQPALCQPSRLQKHATCPCPQPGPQPPVPRPCQPPAGQPYLCLWQFSSGEAAWGPSRFCKNDFSCFSGFPMELQRRQEGRERRLSSSTTRGIHPLARHLTVPSPPSGWDQSWGPPAGLAFPLLALPHSLGCAQSPRVPELRMASISASGTRLGAGPQHLCLLSEYVINK